jgi:hypothetical protein
MIENPRLGVKYEILVEALWDWLAEKKDPQNK